MTTSLVTGSIDFTYSHAPVPKSPNAPDYCIHVSLDMAKFAEAFLSALVLNYMDIFCPLTLVSFVFVPFDYIDICGL